MTNKDYREKKPLMIFLNYFKNHKKLFALDVIFDDVKRGTSGTANVGRRHAINLAEYARRAQREQLRIAGADAHAVELSLRHFFASLHACGDGLHAQKPTCPHLAKL